MSKKSSKNDVGYKAYFAAFAVMLVIVISAVCILSGCLDNIIFTADYPDNNKDTTSIDNENDTEKNTEEIIIDTSETPAPDTNAPEIDTDTESEEIDTTKEPDTTEEDTTKESDSTSADTTTKLETTEEITTEELTTKVKDTEEELLSHEIISEQDNNILYKYVGDGLTVTGYASSIDKISVAKSLDGVRVTKIGQNAFANIEDLEEVLISAGVKEIESGAMSNCPNLNYVYIPTTVKEIASDAFVGSDNLVIYCEEGSYAEHFAEDNAIECYTN